MTQQEKLFIGPATDPDRYQIWRRIGSGGEGEVWLGTRQLTDGTITVAIKAYHPNRLGAEESAESLVGRVETQAARLRQLHDPGIAAVHESFVGPAPHRTGSVQPDDPGTVYLVMKHIEGVPLSEWRGDDGASPAGRLGVLNDVAAALDALHRVGQVHGDIKPSNLIVETLELPDGRTTSRAVLVDFGLMRQIVHAPPSRVVGTQGFIAPELHEQGAYSQASDFYAFACVCAWLVCDGPPGQDLAGALRAAGLSEDIVQTMLVGVAADPEMRSTALGSGIAGWLSRLQSDLSTTRAPSSSIGSMPPVLTPTVPMPVQPGPPDHVGHQAAGVGAGDGSQPQGPAPNEQGRQRRRRPSLLLWLAFLGALLIIAVLLVLRPWQTDDDIASTSSSTPGSSSTEPTTSSTEPTTASTESTTTSTEPTTTSTVPTTTTTVSTTTTTAPPSTTAPSTTAPPTTAAAGSPTRVGEGIRFGGGFGIDLDSDAVDWGRTRNQFAVDIRVNTATFNDRFLTAGDVTVVSGTPNRIGCQDPSAEIMSSIGFERIEPGSSFCVQTSEGGWAWMTFVEFEAGEAVVDIWYWNE